MHAQETRERLKNQKRGLRLFAQYILLVITFFVQPILLVALCKM